MLNRVDDPVGFFTSLKHFLVGIVLLGVIILLIAGRRRSSGRNK